MKRKVNILIHSIILIFILVLFVGNSAVRAEDEVRINHTSYTVNIGDEDNVLQLKMENQKEGDKKPRWVSYNVNVATVDQNGVVTPLRKGKAIISSGIGFPRKTCVVTVVDPSVKLNKSEVTLYRSANENTPGNTITLTARVNGATKKATDVVWSSSDESVVKVEPDLKGRGVVTSVDGENGKTGEAVITARVNGRTASCKVTVLESTISLNVNNMQLSTKGVGSSIKLVPTVVGSKKTVKWTSSDGTVAKVSGGKVTGKKAGTAIVTANANGVETTCNVTVVAEQISINEENILLYVTKNASEETIGETKELKTNAANSDDVTWTSSNVDVVTVEGTTNGKAAVTAVGAGTAVITATCKEKTDTCVVEVKNTSTSIAEKIVHLKTKGTANKYTLDYQVAGRNNKVAWKSSDTKVVSVSKGKLTGKKAGKAIVTMTANGVEDKVQVIVQDYTPTIALNQKEYTLYTTGKGNNVALKATVNGVNKKAEWQSNNASVAEVNTKGKVTAKSKGKALITATANGVTAKCWVTVKEPDIIMEKDELLLKPSDRVNLYEHASIEVIGANQSVTFKSSNTRIATVSAKGLVTAKQEGTAVVTLKSNGVEKTCNVTVSTCEHTFGTAETVRAASCEENGLTVKTCSKCGNKEQEVTDPLGHSFGRWTVFAWSTENAAGLERQVCTRCKAENTRIIPAKNKGDLAYGYKLVWEDDFNGTALDRDSWNVELHEPGWVNAEWQEYVDSDKNIYVKDGNLVIQAIKDGDQYTSGRVNTQNNHDYQYGRFEARAKVPSGKGFLPAFWMMPTDESYYGQWPKCGEIDVMEVLGDQTNKAHSTLHFGEPHTQKQGTYTLADGEADFSEDFHVYACEWDPDEFRFYVDDKLFYTVNDWFTKRPGFGEAAYPAPYDQPFYMILNLAVGGSWVGYPDETTEFGDNAQLVVDYVRVYQKDEYDTNVSKTETDVQLRDPDETGNYIVNGDFAEVEDLSKKEDEQENWKLHLEAEGAATAEIKDEVLHVNSKQIGTVNYHVQIVQADLPIEKGSSYKLTYDAWADEDRTMVTAVKAPDRGYICYMDETMVDLTKESQTFEHVFNMTSDSDANGRVEFNLGSQGSVAAVHIDNVRLEKTGSVEGDEDSRSVLPDGNYVYNGSFNEGNEPGRLRLAYWDWSKGANVSVTSDAKRELKVVVPETVTALDDVVVYQEPIAIKGGKTYVLSFEAHADQAKTIQTAIAGETFESALTTEKKEYRYEFNTAEALDGSELRFLLGAAGTTYIDNVSIREDGLIVNGDFSSGMVGYEVYVNEAAKVTGYIVDSLNDEKNPAFSIDIADTGAQDWYIQLKQNNIKLEEGKWYKIGFDAKSTVDRQIMYALQRDGSKHKLENGDDDWMPYSGTQKINLTKDYQNFNNTFMMTEGTDPETILSISMGAVGGTQVSTKHTVMIDNITLEETDPVEIPPVEEGTEMIQNGDFSDGDAYWKPEIGGGTAEVDFSQGKAVYEITNVGSNDWDVKLNHTEKLTLEAGASYKVSFKIKSTAARTVKYSFMTPAPAYKWYGGQDLSLAADELKEVEYEFTVGNDEKGNALATSDEITFAISMGKIEGEDTPVSTIEIDDVSVKKIGGTGGDTGEDPVIQVGDDLIKNGDFSNDKENWVENPACEGGEATFNVTDGKAVFNITNVGTQSYSVQLKQEGLKLEKDAEYKVSFDIKSSIARNVIYKFQEDQSWTDYNVNDLSLSANEEVKVEKTITVDKATSKKILFLIAMGKMDGEEISGEHTIEIDNVSVVKVSEAGGDTPDDPTIEIGTDLIKNGKFAQGKADWSDYIHTADGAEATTTFADNKARYEITNAGTEDWNVQLKQESLNMEKGAYYKVNFKIGSSIDRDVKLAFMGTKSDGKAAWCGGADIHLTKDKLQSFSTIVDFGYEYESGTVAFQLSMGQLGDTTLTPHAIEISDISVTKVEPGTEADEVTEEEVTITPPTGSGEDPVEDRTNVANLKDDFSEKQGSKGWYYGSADWDGKNFTELSYNAGESKYTGENDLAVGADFVHPGAGPNAAYKWIAAETGTIEITGEYVKFANSEDSEANGVVLRIVKGTDGLGEGDVNQKFFSNAAQKGGITDEEKVPISVSLEVNKGDEILFLVNPEGNNSYDGGKLSISIAPASGDTTPNTVKRKGTTPPDTDAADKKDADKDAGKGKGEGASVEDVSEEDTGDGTGEEALEEDAGNTGEGAEDDEAMEEIVVSETKE
ncbi:MAG: carbohydrate binding domain-containing protein [Lachnospiraceae bacterium]|nr:carbohydrate binding domain-containing protein [Lachnospiraceae bacterium]